MLPPPLVLATSTDAHSRDGASGVLSACDLQLLVASAKLSDFDIQFSHVLINKAEFYHKVVLNLGSYVDSDIKRNLNPNHITQVTLLRSHFFVKFIE